MPIKIIKVNDERYILSSSIQHLDEWIKNLNKYKIINESIFSNGTQYRLWGENLFSGVMFGLNVYYDDQMELICRF